MTISPKAQVHPTAVIEDGAVINDDCTIGPYCIIRSDVTLGRNVELRGHVNLAGKTSIGDGTRIFPFASIGEEPQDLKFAGETVELIIGANNTIREHVTMNPGTTGGGGITRVGDNNLFMMGAHVAHDCWVGSDVVVANNVALAGHVEIGDRVVLGGLCGIHQFCRIGEGAMIGALAMVVADVIPFGTAMGDRATLAGLNLTGLKRRNAAKSDLHGLRAAFRDLFDGNGTLQERAKQLAESDQDNHLVDAVTEFILADSTRSFLTP